MRRASHVRQDRPAKARNEYDPIRSRTVLFVFFLSRVHFTLCLWFFVNVRRRFYIASLSGCSINPIAYQRTLSSRVSYIIRIVCIIVTTRNPSKFVPANPFRQNSLVLISKKLDLIANFIDESVENAVFKIKSRATLNDTRQYTLPNRM